MNYAHAITEARERAGLTKQQLASAAGLSPAFITRLENGSKNPSIETLQAIADALGLPVAVLALMASSGDDLVRGVTVEDAEEISRLMTELLDVMSRNLGQAED